MTENSKLVDTYSTGCIKSNPRAVTCHYAAYSTSVSTSAHACTRKYNSYRTCHCWHIKLSYTKSGRIDMHLLIVHDFCKRYCVLIGAWLMSKQLLHDTCCRNTNTNISVQITIPEFAEIYRNTST